MSPIHNRVHNLVEPLSRLEGDELAAAIIKEVQWYQEIERTLPWVQGILYHLAYKKYNDFSWATKSQYTNRVDFLRQVFGGQHDSWNRLGEFLFSKDMRKLPQGFNLLECHPSKVLDAIGAIRRDEMTEELWAALRNPEIGVKEFGMLLHGDKQEET